MKNLYPQSATGLFYAVIAAILFFDCSGSGSPVVNNHQADSLPVLRKDNRKKPPSSFSDTVVIRSRSAVFYLPDSLQLVKIKGANEKMIFESLMHDCNYQMKNARLLIQRDWPHLQIIDVSKFRWINFFGADGSRRIIDLDSINDICGIYLFDPTRAPELIDMMNIDTELGFYFKNR